jgi:hypothetical protein
MVIWMKKKKQKLQWCVRGLNLFKKLAILSFSFMVIQFDSVVSPEAGCDLLKKKRFNFCFPFSGFSCNDKYA